MKVDSCQRRGMIEPEIDHMKTDGRLARSPLKGGTGARSSRLSGVRGRAITSRWQRDRGVQGELPSLPMKC
ncbi:hypothetical protein D2N39_22335 [Gemmobacter lutimaris]|uniref:Uncharacterized protein n=1 Tax=Gemmobacter lutimaris TaxID=2306023 RepID=A0A398BR06_9RHOB|nr:hypothetical protein D2N39_22335 [Gemmobacter lutimaris]